MKLLIYITFIFIFLQSSGLYAQAGTWTSIGPTTLPVNKVSQPGGMGRINAIAFDPSNASKIYAGSPAGGLWVTSNGGTSWTSLSDALSTLGVSSIVVDKNSASTIYVGTGDRDHGDAAGLGVIKSTNSGASWSSVNSGMGNRTVNKLIMNPSNSNILIAATSGGIYRTVNGGSSWTAIISNINFTDVVYKPKNPRVVYASAIFNGSNRFYRSIDGGVTYSQITNGLTAAYRGVIGVSPADTNLVYYVVTNFNTYSACYVSGNGGTSFSTTSTSPNIMDGSFTPPNTGGSGQAWYDLCVAVDTANSANMYVGGVNIYKSTNSGAGWTRMTYWATIGSVHADHHAFAINPLNNRLYVGNDGGLFYTANAGSNWTDISSGLAITQMYKIGQSATREDCLIAGIQDNGTSKIDNGKWSFIFGGDGMQCAYDPLDTNYVYTAIYYGDIYRSSNGANGINSFTKKVAGKNTDSITEAGDWVTPFMISKANTSVMFAGYNNLWRSSNIKASTPGFSKISSGLSVHGTDFIETMDQSSANTDIFYMADNDYRMFLSTNITNSAPTWTNITSHLPYQDALVIEIKAHPNNANSVYIIQNQQVFLSNTKGTTSAWVDITGSLPNVAKNVLVLDKNSNSGIYVGTDAGVYYRDSSMSDWVAYYTGLPTAATITDLAIYYDPNTSSNNKIKAGTFGRGAWQNTLIPASMLPITLLDFNATLENHEVRLDWETASEINNAYFTIERSKDGISFSSLFNKAGAGNSQVRLDYTAWDEKPMSGTSYYRLKQTDYNGAFSYSMIRAVNVPFVPVSFQTFPNPFSTSTTVTYEIEKTSDINLSLFDISGRQIGIITKENQEPGKYVYDINTERYNLHPGIYMLKLTTGDGNVSRTIVKF